MLAGTETQLAQAPEAAESPSDSPLISEGYRRYVLGLLCVVYLFNFVDRQIMVILAVPIQHEFGLSDTQLGLLSGFVFALVYSTFGVPVAYLADRTSRKLVIGLSLGFWSLMTALGGLATGFVSLALARVGVGIGESGCSPPATSLLSDYFPPSRRAWANSIYSAAIYGGYLVAFVAGGLISEHFGWRWAFVLVGAPGLLLAGVLALTLREPPRGWSDGFRAVAAPKLPLLGALGELWRVTSFRWIIVASSLHAFATLGVNSFMPLFLARSHAMGQAQIGVWLGPISGISGMLGTLLGGYLADRWARGGHGRRGAIWVCAVSVLASVPFSFVTYLHPNAPVALAAYAPAMLLGVMYLGPALTTIQELAGPRMRAVSVSVFYLFNNLLGLGAGAWVTGVMSDGLAQRLGNDALRYSLCIMVAVNLGSFLCYAFGARTLPADHPRSRP
jgi:MFS family permease